MPGIIHFCSEEKIIVDKEVNSLLEKQAIQKVDNFDPFEEGQFFSNIFLVPKKNGQFRPIINLKQLNEFVVYEHFKQETLKVILQIIQKDDYLTSIDLKDAYFSIPIHQDCYKYLRFTWRSQVYQFVVLCFGLSSAPRIFTKVIKPVFAFFRKLNIRCGFYIDDSLQMNQQFESCKNNAIFMVNKLESLGFDVNRKKSELVPTKRIVFFGLIIDTHEFKVYLTDEKIKKILDLCHRILLGEGLTIRIVASLIGLLVHAFYAVLPAPLHYRSIERDKIWCLNRSSDDYDANIVLSVKSKDEISWWVKNVQKYNGKPIINKPPTVWIETDASKSGWGAKFDNNCIGGRWTISESFSHINILELKAVFFALRSFFSGYKNVHIGIKSDNITAVTYINDMGGIQSLKLDQLSKEIWEWCMERDIFIFSQYIPGIENIHADRMSRQFSDNTEWQLKSEIFKRICNQLFMPSIDLFASRLNCQLECYASWSFDPEASIVDAFSVSWKHMEPYIFPPFNLIGRVMSKIILERVSNVIIVIPNWTSQPWFPLVMSHLVSFPIRLPKHKDLLFQPHNLQIHPMINRLNLTVCHVSGDSSLSQAFRNKLPISSLNHGVQEHQDNMNLLGNHGLFGVLAGKEVSLVPLKRTY